MKTIFLVVPDLFFQTKIEDTARHLGYSVSSARAGEGLPEAIAHAYPALVIVSLDAPAWQEAISAARAAGARTLAFGPHVRTELIEAARAAGCDQVIARSLMNAQLPQLLRKWMEPPHVSG